jgi:putative heme-binding domain-containing protein
MKHRFVSTLAAGAAAAVLVPCRADSNPDPAAELASMKVLDGFEATLVASEADGVVKPIQIRFDADGRLWVAGSTVYPQVKPTETPDDKIVYLNAPEGGSPSGRASVFADHLMIPTGIEWGGGGLYVGAAGELLHFRDTDGDGRADVRTLVFGGFGTGDAHQTINSFTWGPSGELMMSQGLHADTRVETPWGVEQLKQAGVMRFWPRRLRIDPFWTGAMGPHNPFGTVFDRWGQPIVLAGNGHGVYHLTQASIRTDHFLEQPWLWNQSRKFAGGDFVENSRWPAANQGELISGGYLQNTVERFRLADDGSTFKVERLAPLVESSDKAFRIVDVRFGPDGALYMADWYNPVIGHYQASFRDPARDKAHGRIWRVAPKGAPAIAWRKLNALSEADLAMLLGSKERWNRQMAKRVLADRAADKALPAVRAWVAGADHTDGDRFEALGVFAAHEVIDTNLLDVAIHAATPELRAYAARIVGQFADRLPNPLARLETLVGDAHPRVRLEAVVACSYVADPRAVEIAARAADQPMDAALEYAFTQCVHALAAQWRPLMDAGKLAFDGKPSRQGAFAKAAGGAGAAKLAAGRLRRIGEVALDAPTVANLAETIAASGGPDELAVLLDAGNVRIGGAHAAEIHARALNLAAEAAHAGGAKPKAPEAALQALAKDPSVDVQAAALRLAGAWQVDALRGDLTRIAGDKAATQALRKAAFDGLSGFGDEKAADLLRTAAQSAEPKEARLDAAMALSRIDAMAAARAAAAMFDEMTSERVEAAAAELLRRKEGAHALRAAIRDQPPKAPAAKALLGVFAGSGRSDAYTEKMLRRLAGTASGGERPTLADAPKLAAEVRETGDPVRGKSVFFRPELGCSTCHSVDGAPGKIGPDLGPLGRSQTVEFILGAILEPQKEVKEGFMAYEVTTKDGEVYQGYLRGETTEAITLFDHLTRQTVRVAKAQAESTRQLGSLMPSGLTDSMSRGDFVDLVRFLSELGR